jgi:hypothetical protein
MRSVRDKVIDDVMDAYVAWREVSAAVDHAYRRCSTSRWTDPGGAFAAYASTLDREEMASLYYEQVLQRAVRLLVRERRRRSAAGRRRLGARRPSRRRRRIAAGRAPRRGSGGRR